MDKDLEMDIRHTLVNGLLEVRSKFIYLRAVREDENTFRLEADIGMFLCEKLLNFINDNVTEECICVKTKTCPYRIKG